MTRNRLAAIAIVVAIFCNGFVPGAIRADILHGLAAIGDSGQAASASNSPPVLLQNLLGLNFGGPGLPYDPAHSGASGFSVIQPGDQVDQIVSQINAGNVTLAFIAASDNDTLPNLNAVANGSISGPALLALENQAVQQVETAVSTILAAGGHVVLTGYSNIVDAPPASAIFNDPTMKARAEGALNDLNTQLLGYANAHGVPFVNMYQLEKNVFDAGSLVVGGVNINLFTSGPDPHNFYASSVSAGTVIRAEVANLWLDAMNRGYGTNVPLFTDQDILTLAGIGNEYNGVESFSTPANLALYTTPEPSSFVLLAAGLSIATLYRVRRARSRSCRS